VERLESILSKWILWKCWYSLPLPSARHQPKLQDHGRGAWCACTSPSPYAGSISFCRRQRHMSASSLFVTLLDNAVGETQTQYLLIASPAFSHTVEPWYRGHTQYLSSCRLVVGWKQPVACWCWFLTYSLAWFVSGACYSKGCHCHGPFVTVSVRAVPCPVAVVVRGRDMCIHCVTYILLYIRRVSGKNAPGNFAIALVKSLHICCTKGFFYRICCAFYVQFLTFCFHRVWCGEILRLKIC